MPGKTISDLQDQSGSSNSPEALGRFLEIQSREIDVKSKELDVRRDELGLNAEYARANLDAQLVDRKDDRANKLTEHKWNTVSGTIMILGVLLFGGAAIYFGHSEIVLEIVRFGIVLVGGYGWGYHQGRKKKQTEPLA